MYNADFLVLETRASEVEQKFAELTERKDIAIVLINQHVSEKWRERTYI